MFSTSGSAASGPSAGILTEPKAADEAPSPHKRLRSMWNDRCAQTSGQQLMAPGAVHKRGERSRLRLHASILRRSFSTEQTTLAGKQASCRASDVPEKVLLWQAYSDSQDQCIEAVFQGLRDAPKTRPLIMTRRWDAAKQTVSLSACQQPKVMYKVHCNVPNADHWLDEDTKRKMCDLLGDRHGVCVKLCQQRCHLAWGGTVDDQEIVIIRLVLQHAGTASCDREILHSACMPLNTDTLLPTMSSVVTILLAILASDAGGDCKRAKLEIEVETDELQNVLVWNTKCYAHQSGSLCRDASKFYSMISNICQIIGAVRDIDAEREWMASCAAVSTARLNVSLVSGVLHKITESWRVFASCGPQ